MKEDQNRSVGDSHSGGPSNGEGWSESWLELRLEETAAAERERAPVDAEPFLARLRARLAASPGTQTMQRFPVRSWAAVIAIALVLAWLFSSSFSPVLTPPIPGEGSLAADNALIEELDLLELLAELVPAGAEEFDPELIELYVDFEIIDELPVELLGSSG